MSASVRLVINRSVIAELNEESSGLGSYLTRQGQRVKNKARVNAPVDTGNLRGSVAYELLKVNGVLVVRVGTNVPYGVYVRRDNPGGWLRDAL